MLGKIKRKVVAHLVKADALETFACAVASEIASGATFDCAALDRLAVRYEAQADTAKGLERRMLLRVSLLATESSDEARKRAAGAH
jgi:hypothetical protein